MAIVFRSILALALCALAAGCITTSAEQQAKLDSERCIARGIQPGTKEFEFCMGQIGNDRDARIQQRRQEMLERSAAPPLLRGQ